MRTEKGNGRLDTLKKLLVMSEEYTHLHEVNLNNETHYYMSEYVPKIIYSAIKLELS